MERPGVNEQTVYIGVDGGYSNLGIVAARVWPGKSRVLFAQSAKQKNRGHDNDSMRAHCRAMAQRVYAVGASFGWRNLVWGYEDWKGGKSTNTVRWRSYFDGLVLNELERHGQQILIVGPTIHKQVLNPMGTATDDGRETDLEYLAALNSLDSIWSGDSLKSIAEPQTAGDVKRTWKAARQHSLDAGAIAAVAAFACRFDPRTGLVHDFPKLPKGQIVAAEKVAEASQIL